MKKRSALALAAALLVPSAAFAAPQSAASALDAIAARQRFAHAIVAADVYDLDAKRQLYVRNAAVLMEAASTTKLLTTGTSLALLGPNFRWTTPVYRIGTVDSSGVLHGDLVMVASGDPNLSQRIGPTERSRLRTKITRTTEATIRARFRATRWRFCEISPRR